MSGSKEFTLDELATHNTKKDLYVTIHDKVYDASVFVDEHPYVLTFLFCQASWLFGIPVPLPQWCLWILVLPLLSPSKTMTP